MLDTWIRKCYTYFRNKENTVKEKERTMTDLNIINHIYSVELNLDRETIDTINKLSEVFNLDRIFTVKDTKLDILQKLAKLYPKVFYIKTHDKHIYQK